MGQTWARLWAWDWGQRSAWNAGQSRRRSGAGQARWRAGRVLGARVGSAIKNARIIPARHAVERGQCPPAWLLSHARPALPPNGRGPGGELPHFFSERPQSPSCDSLTVQLRKGVARSLIAARWQGQTALLRTLFNGWFRPRLRPSPTGIGIGVRENGASQCVKVSLQQSKGRQSFDRERDIPIPLHLSAGRGEVQGQARG